ncbi:MAG: type II secretion system F family protein [Acutalibacteraceae bacterium]
MPEFRYSVVDQNGRTLSGTMEADNLDICRKIIAQRGLYCLELTEASVMSRSLNFGNKSKFDVKTLSVFCRQFATMLSSGISIIKSLDILHSQWEKESQKAIIKKIYDGVLKGRTFSEVLKEQKTFPDLMVNMIEAGEADGTLDRVMSRLSEHYDKSVKTANKVKSAMIYPIILGVLTVSVVVILMVFVLPVFTKMFESSGTPLPLPTKILVALSNSLINYWYVYFIVISSVSITWISFLKNEKGRLAWDKFKTRIPIAGKLIVTIISARFSQTLSSLMQSGIPLLKSLEITSRVLGNTYYEARVMEAAQDVRRGKSLSTAIKSINVFPIMLQSALAIGEESGTTDDVLVKTAAYYDEEANSAITKLVGLLEPIMIVLMALIVGFIVISIILPMYGSIGNI